MSFHLLMGMRISTILLKYPTFEVGISYFHGQNKFKIRVSDLCGIHTKKLITLKVRKISILGLK